MRRSAGVAAALAAWAAGVPGPPAATAVAGDPLCIGNYAAAAPQVASAPVRFGVDPGIAGSVGGVQLPSVADDPVRDLQALQALRPARRVLVLRLNRLFWSDGEAGIARFLREASTYTRDGFEVEIQVRYHPASGRAGDLRAWQAYVRRVVDAFGANRRVVAMTITNEVNVAFSPNTSDGFYARAEDALIQGIEAASAQAARRHFHQLRFGFTYAYRFVPTQDAAFFSYLAAHGGEAFRRALDFVGLDFYPGSIYPPVMLPGDSYRNELAQAAGTLRRCLMPLAAIPPSTPIWITENGVPTGLLTEAQQASALTELVRAVRDYSGTFNITDYRWFNLRDSTSAGVQTLVGATFASDGLLRADYTRKPSFTNYRRLVGEFGAMIPSPVPKRWAPRPPHPDRHAR
jgi:hypothetical protein